VNRPDLFLTIFGGTVAIGATVAVLAMIDGCTARQVARTEYEVQSESCVRIYKGDAAVQKSCLEYVRAKWTKAGAPPAVTDGGDQ